MFAQIVPSHSTVALFFHFASTELAMSPLQEQNGFHLYPTISSLFDTKGILGIATTVLFGWMERKGGRDASPWESSDLYFREKKDLNA